MILSMHLWSPWQTNSSGLHLYWFCTSPHIITLLESYLKGGKNYVFLSSKYYMCFGVPQRSILGPALAYADDVIIFNSIKDSCGTDLCLVLNVDKCYYIGFSKNTHSDTRNCTCRVLGHSICLDHTQTKTHLEQTTWYLSKKGNTSNFISYYIDIRWLV